MDKAIKFQATHFCPKLKLSTTKYSEEMNNEGIYEEKKPLLNMIAYFFQYSVCLFYKTLLLGQK